MPKERIGGKRKKQTEVQRLKHLLSVQRNSVGRKDKAEIQRLVNRIDELEGVKKQETYEEYVKRVLSSKTYQEGMNQNKTFAKLSEGLDSKTQAQLQRFVENGTKVYSSVPKGYIKIEGATTAPKGLEWYSNGKSRFGGEYKNALVKIKK